MTIDNPKSIFKTPLLSMPWSKSNLTLFLNWLLYHMYKEQKTTGEFKLFVTWASVLSSIFHPNCFCNE